MSNLAWYFHTKGSMAGHDKIDPLTDERRLKAWISITTMRQGIAAEFKDKTNTLGIRTPAVPNDLGELFFR